jgi:hypothetical protein
LIDLGTVLRAMFFIRVLIAASSVAFCISIAAQPATAQQQRPVAEELVRTTFISFKHALMGRDGVRAASYIDDETAAFYEKMRQAALNTHKAELLKSKLFFQVAVLLVRHYFSQDDIQGITGRDLYGKTVSIGDTSASMGFESLSLLKVTPDENGQTSTADLGLEGRPETFRLKFLNRRGVWQIVLMDLITIGSDELQARFGISPTTSPSAIEQVIVQYMFPAMVQVSGRPVTDAIWTPLSQRK